MIPGYVDHAKYLFDKKEEEYDKEKEMYRICEACRKHNVFPHIVDMDKITIDEEYTHVWSEKDFE